MVPGRFLLSSSAAWFVLAGSGLGCSGRVDPPLPVGSGGVLLGSGGSSSGGNSSASGGGGTGGALVLPPPMDDWPYDCELAAQSTEWGRAHSGESCFDVESFWDTNSSLSPPTFPAGSLEGMGGAGGGAPVVLCPSASELDWSCQVGEGRCCPTPQCEPPASQIPVDGQCCYIVARICGV